MNIQYREITPSDIPGVAKIRAAEWESEEYWIWRISGYLSYELHPGGALMPRIMYAAVDENRIVGFIAGHLTTRMDCEGELQWVNVIPECRNKGIASSLIKLLAKWFIVQNAVKVCVNGNGSLYSNNGAFRINEHWMVWPDIGQLLKT